MTLGPRLRPFKCVGTGKESLLVGGEPNEFLERSRKKLEFESRVRDQIKPQVHNGYVRLARVCARENVRSQRFPSFDL